jgi:uncharacterized membrane protein
MVNNPDVIVTSKMQNHLKQEKNMQLIVGTLLRTGVFASIGIAFIGGIIYLTRHGHEHVDYRHFTGIPDYVRPAHIFKSIADGKGRAIIQAGIMLLIATPVLRIIFSGHWFCC